jgi:hypothetical protein
MELPPAAVPSATEWSSRWISAAMRQCCTPKRRGESRGTVGARQGRKPLKSERVNMAPRRYQRGSIVWRNTKNGKVCYGMYRVDVQTDAGIKREQKKVRVGTRKEFPTDSQARKKLNDIISYAESRPPVPSQMNYGELAKRWQESEGPTQTKPTADRYAQVLRAWLLPFWKDQASHPSPATTSKYS